MIPQQNKSSGVPPVKDPENPEIEQLQVYIDEEDTENEIEDQHASSDIL